MPDRPPLTGLVLAGGASRRMGTDKARLDLDGEPLVVRAVRRLSEVCGRVLVASGDGRRLDDLGVEQVADPPERGGPLAGIVAGLTVADTPLVAVVGVDMPRLDPRVLVRLATTWRGEAAVVPLVAGRVQPLHGVYASAAADRFRRELDAGRRSVVHALSALGARVVGPEGWGEFDPDGTFVGDLDTPADLETPTMGGRGGRP